jgi:hypothetical protein
MTKIVRRLDANHDPYWGKGLRDFCTKTESTAQRVRTAMLMVRGEWFLDTDYGPPWWQHPDSNAQAIMGVPANLGYAEATMKAVILGVEGVTAITSFVMDFNRETRALSVSVKALDDDGVTFDVVLQDPGP